jgi:hypothetical protein
MFISQLLRKDRTMSVYTTSAEFASANDWMPAEFAEERYGAHAAKTGRVAKHGTSWSIMEDGAYRQASPLEIGGIEDYVVASAKALSHFAGYELDEAIAITLEEMTDASETLDDADAWLLDAMADEATWRDYCDTRNALLLGILMF